MRALTFVLGSLLAAQADGFKFVRTAVPPARRDSDPRQRATSSILSRVVGTHLSLLDAPFSLLPRVDEEDFARSLDKLNRAVNGLVHVETDEQTKDMTITFDDMGMFSKVDVAFDDKSGVLSVHGQEGEGDNLAESTRAVTVPCAVSNPELLTAETRDGRVLVVVPHEAQARMEKKLKNKKLDVHLLSGKRSAKKQENATNEKMSMPVDQMIEALDE